MPQDGFEKIQIKTSWVLQQMHLESMENVNYIISDAHSISPQFEITDSYCVTSIIIM